MAFTKEQRIQISKKVIDIPIINKSLDGVVANLDVELIKVTNEDNGNKDLMDRITPTINAYQDEIEVLDGNQRNELTEQNMLDSANKIKQNFFYPNDFEVSMPDIPDGIWKFLLPFSGNIAIGANYNQSYTPITNEPDTLTEITNLIASIEGYAEVERLSGKQCTVEDQGSCMGETPPASGVDQPTCVLNGGTWTPLLVGIKSPSDLVPDFNTLISKVNTWKTLLQTQKTAIQTADGLDTIASHNSENAIAIADIDAAIAEIDSWLAIQDFDTRSLPSDCSDFNDLDETDFDPAKLTSTVIQIIKDEVTARQAFTTTRLAQVGGYLGTVGQDLTTGNLNGSGSGFYNERFNVINIRINLLGGSLNKKLSTIKGKDAQGVLQDTNNNASNLYDTAIKVSKFKAPAANTGTIHVLDASAFTIGDSVYIVAEKQEELSGTILNIDGNTVFLDFTVPEKYTHFNSSRLYKVL